MLRFMSIEMVVRRMKPYKEYRDGFLSRLKNPLEAAAYA